MSEPQMLRYAIDVNAFPTLTNWRSPMCYVTRSLGELSMPEPEPEPAPQPAKAPLSHTAATILTGLVFFALMGLANLINAVSAGALTLPAQFVPLVPYLMVPATLAVYWVMRQIKMVIPDLPSTEPAALLSAEHCDGCWDLRA